MTRGWHATVDVAVILWFMMKDASSKAQEMPLHSCALKEKFPTAEKAWMQAVNEGGASKMPEGAGCRSSRLSSCAVKLLLNKTFSLIKQ